MSPLIDQPNWWDLHLRKARGETLSEQEQLLYDTETARQDREAAPLKIEFNALREMRKKALTLGRDNAELRRRVAELETEIRDTFGTMS